MIKTHNTSGFIRIPVSVIKDKTLSLEEKAIFGLIAYYEQLPNFQLNRTYICSRHKIGPHALKSCIDTLKVKQYASCTHTARNWSYNTTYTDKHFTNIPKTILSSDLTLPEIGLYMIIAYTITLPGVHPGIQLYESYCTNCRKSCLDSSKKLKLAGLYKAEQLGTCKFNYSLFTLMADGSLVLYAAPVNPYEKTSSIETPDSKPESTAHESETDMVTSSDTLTHDMKELLFYEHETKHDFWNFEEFQDGCMKSTKKMIYDMIISAAEYARQIKYIKINGIKVYYEKFFNDYMVKLADRNIREQVVNRIMTTLNGDSKIFNIDLYICGIIVKTIPLACISQAKSERYSYEKLAHQFGNELANQEYVSAKRNTLKYTFRNGSFYKLSGASCA